MGRQGEKKETYRGPSYPDGSEGGSMVWGWGGRLHSLPPRGNRGGPNTWDVQGPTCDRAQDRRSQVPRADRVKWGRRQGGRGQRGKGEGSSRGSVIVVVVTAVVGGTAIVGNEGVEGAANHLGDGGRSYGGPKREGRVIVQRGKDGKRGSEGERLGVKRTGKRGGGGERSGEIGEGGKLGKGPIRVVVPSVRILTC